MDPLNVSHLPNLKFLGPEKQSDSFRKTVNENLINWDSNNDILVEILELIGMFLQSVLIYSHNWYSDFFISSNIQKLFNDVVLF